MRRLVRYIIGREKGIRSTATAAAAILLRRKIGARCGETVTYYSRATFHYTSFHSTPRAYYWHVFPLALSRIPISRIGKFLFLFPPAVIRHATHVEATRSPIVLRQYVLYKCLMEKRRGEERKESDYVELECLAIPSRLSSSPSNKIDKFRFYSCQTDVCIYS